MKTTMVLSPLSKPSRHAEPLLIELEAYSHTKKKKTRSVPSLSPSRPLPGTWV